VLQIGIDGALICRLFTGGCRRRPLPEIIEPPGPDKVCVGVSGVARRLCLCHVAVGDRAPRSRPLVRIAALDAPQRIAGISRLDAQQRIGADLRAGERLGPDLLDAPIGRLGRRNLADQTRQRGPQDNMKRAHGFPFPSMRFAIMVMAGKE